MKRYITRNPKPRVWQVIAANKARAIDSAADVSDADIERMYNRAAVVTLTTRKAARRFIESIGGTWE